MLQCLWFSSFSNLSLLPQEYQNAKKDHFEHLFHYLNQFCWEKSMPYPTVTAHTPFRMDSLKSFVYLMLPLSMLRCLLLISSRAAYSAMVRNVLKKITPPLRFWQCGSPASPGSETRIWHRLRATCHWTGAAGIPQGSIDTALPLKSFQTCGGRKTSGW